MFARPEKLQETHDVSAFDCGQDELNSWLRRYALTNQQAGMSVTYVVTQQKNQRVLAYYTLATGSVAPNEATERIVKGTGKYQIPILLLARLAVDRSVQGKGVGYSLMKDVLWRTVSVANQVGLRALVVDALDADARSFYLKCGFEPSPVDRMRLMLLIKDIRKSLGV